MAARKFYCSEVVNPETNKLEYNLKEAKDKKVLKFKTQREAIRHIKNLKIDAIVWFRQHGRFVSLIKTSQDSKYENTDEIEIVKIQPKKASESMTKTDEILTKDLDEADNLFAEEELVVVEKEEPTAVRELAPGFFESEKQEKYTLIGAMVVFALLVLLVILIIFAAFSSI
ncbi:hypothetical protein ACW95P_02975 [Candidatus Mycoplasma pogonae]